jgi:hypothetical protein
LADEAAGKHGDGGAGFWGAGSGPRGGDCDRDGHSGPDGGAPGGGAWGGGPGAPGGGFGPGAPGGGAGAPGGGTGGAAP